MLLGRSLEFPAFGGRACPRCKYPPRKRFFGKKLESALKGGDLNPQSCIKNRVAKDAWQQVFIRDTERRELWADMFCFRIYPREEDNLPGEECWLIIRKDSKSGEVKYQFSNASRETSIDRLAEMSGSRYWIERTFEDGKGIAGLADYQVRNWTGWHHHMTMTLLAMLYIMSATIDLGKKAEFLTVQDMKEVFEVIMPKRKITNEEILRLILEKHKVRLSARRSHHRREK